MQHSELVKRFHSLARRYHSFAYDRFKDDLNQEAELCAIQGQFLSYQGYAKEVMRRVRRLLVCMGYRATVGNFDILCQPSLMELFTMNEYVLKYLHKNIALISPDALRGWHRKAHRNGKH